MNEELIAEGRGYFVNAVAAYAEGFGLLNREVDQEFLEKVEDAAASLEALVPVFKSMWTATNLLSGKNMTFMEWLEFTMEKGDIGKMFGAGPD
jgi:hypothetical protein